MYLPKNLLTIPVCASAERSLFESNQWSIPCNQWSIPRNQWSVPRNQWSVPRNQWSIPRNQRSIPRNQRSIPHNQRSIPHNQRSIPCNQWSIPRDISCQVDYWIQTSTRRRIWRYCQNLCWEEDTKSVFETVVTFPPISEIVNCLHIISD